MSLIDKTPAALEVGRAFAAMGFRITATEGTQAFLAANGVACERINKLLEGRPNIADGIMNREIQLVINTPAGKRSVTDDSYIRKTAIKYKVPYITTLAAARAAARGIEAARAHGQGGVKPLQAYHAELR